MTALTALNTVRKFVLVDIDRIIRRYYNGTDRMEVEKIKIDIRPLLKSNRINSYEK